MKDKIESNEYRGKIFPRCQLELKEDKGTKEMGKVCACHKKEIA